MVKATNMATKWTTFIDQSWEEDDVEAGLQAFEALLSAQQLPLPVLIRQLLALALSPTAALNPKNSPRFIASPSLDAFPTTARAIRHSSLRLLRCLSYTSTLILTRALPSYPASDEDSEMDLNDMMRGEIDVREEDDDTKALMASGKRVGSVEDVWQFLKGSAGKAKLDGDDEMPAVIEGGGWEVLRFLVELWQLQASQHSPPDPLLAEPHYSPSLLRQFKTPQFGPRTVSARALDVIFLPFSSSVDHVGAPRLAEDDDDLEVGERKTVAIELLGLLGQLSLNAKIDSTELFRQLIHNYLAPLSITSFNEFFSYLLSSAKVAPPFAAKLCSTYIDLQSTPVSKAPFHRSANGALPPASPQISPRRRVSTQSQGSQSQSQDETPFVPHPSALHQLPSPSVLLQQCERLSKTKSAGDTVKLTLVKFSLGELVLEFGGLGEEEGEQLAERLSEVLRRV